MTHIITTSLLGQVVSNRLTPPDPTTIENYGHLIIQALVAIVTIWATVRKALQKPEAVVKVPLEAVPGKKKGINGGMPNDGGAE
ncbi:hypothetical protein [Hymenobacter saemangeumensis]